MDEAVAVEPLCRIFAEQLELRFKVEGTPDKHTLLPLKLDPSVNTTQEDGIFSQRQAAQLLMDGEYLRRLVRQHKLMVARVGSAGSSVSGSASSSSLVPGKRPASGATGGAAKNNMGINTDLIPEPMGTCVEKVWFWSQNPWEINSFLAFALSRVVGKG